MSVLLVLESLHSLQSTYIRMFIPQLYCRLFTAVNVAQFSVTLDYISYFEMGHDLILPQPFPFINLFILILP